MKAHSIISLVIWAVLLSFGAPTEAGAQTFTAKDGKVEFTSSVPLHTFTGISNELTGQINPESGVVDFYVDLATLKTGIGKRDKDMRNTLEVERFPFAEFFGALTTQIDLSSMQVQPVSANGKFSLHGVSRDVTVTGTLVKEENNWLLNAEWFLLLGDYQIEPPKLLVMKVDERQEIRISVLLKPETK